MSHSILNIKTLFDKPDVTDNWFISCRKWGHIIATEQVLCVYMNNNDGLCTVISKGQNYFGD